MTDEVTTYPCAPDDLHTALTTFQDLANEALDDPGEAAQMLHVLGDETPAAYNGDEVPPEASVTLVRDQS